MREIWADGGCVLTTWLLGNSAYSAEVIANEAFDAVVVDMQHGIIDFQAAAELLQAISTKAPVPIARMPWNDPSPIMRLLDAGAYGIICPMVNNRAECEQFIAACRYPPLGERSYGPLRAMLYGRRGLLPACQRHHRHDRNRGRLGRPRRHHVGGRP